MAGVARPLRCLVVVPTLGRGGAERQAALLAVALRDQGFDVRLHVFGPPDSLARDGVTGTLAVEVPPPSSTAAQVVRLRRAVETFAPDAVITFLRGAEARFAIVRSTSAAARRAAWIVAIRGSIRLLYFALNPAMFVAQLAWLRACDRIAVNSPALGANLLSFEDALVGKIVVTPNTLLPFAHDLVGARARVDALIGGAARRPVIGCIGSFQDERNYELLADALPIVHRERPGVRALIIGRSTGHWISSVAATFQARVTALGLDAHVILAGEIPHARALLPGFDVFALPSKLEGSSNALAEAMIAGAPTAAVPVADAAELVGGAGVVARGFTPSAFAEALLAALGDGAALRVRAAARGQALLAERSPERMGARWAELVEEAVEAATERTRGGVSPDRSARTAPDPAWASRRGW